MRLAVVAPMLALLAPPASGLTSTGCLGSCSGVGWRDGLSLYFENVDWRVTYQFEIEAERELHRVWECPAAVCNSSRGDRLHVGLSGSVLHVQHVGDLTGPERLTLRVFRNGLFLFDYDITGVTYETSEPAGRGCGTSVSAWRIIELPTEPLWAPSVAPG